MLREKVIKGWAGVIDDKIDDWLDPNDEPPLAIWRKKEYAKRRYVKVCKVAIHILEK